MQRTTVDLWVGIFVTAGLIGLLVLALKVGNASSVSVSDGYTITADFDNIGGLKARAPVKSAGVVVGRVEQIAFDNEVLRARVIMRIDKRYEFPKDSSVSILTSGLLGDQFIGIDGGGDVELLKDGDRVRLTQSAIVLEKVIGQFLYGKAAEGGSGD
ncbi:MAG: outer membrane lipid asymmetry maintenance protein MlaD [Betaproteobacteria bacterium SG8_40]|jgi:phospholipid/cholesterol/gamma-HCH transport system substrate-binding protein|nr:MAG: outer membrane lipid asymmetry maintenance protein MlaD [Betaproteobacteria bacterium SG8_40]